MTIKAIFRKITGRGGALNRATTTREICQLNVLALSLIHISQGIVR